MARVQSLGAVARLGWNGGAGAARAKSAATLAPGLWAMLTIAEVVSVGVAPARDFAFEKRVEQGSLLPVVLTQAVIMLARALRGGRGGAPVLATGRGKGTPEAAVTKVKNGKKGLAQAPRARVGGG